jgi:hypothetical protein
MRIILILSIVFFSGCTNAEQVAKECIFSFGKSTQCTGKGIEIELVSEKVADDEINLKNLKVKSNGKTHLLPITKETNLLDGDKGVILIQDINFDSHPDLAVSTSFGLSNLYMDYWVFDSDSNKFNYIGNFTRFSINEEDKKLSNTVKTNAADFEKNTYKWEGKKLVKSN